MKSLTDAQSQLVLGNQGIARSRAIWYFSRLSGPARCHTHLDDLIGAANLGLCQAAATFDSSRGTFGPWASQRITGAILDYARAVDPETRGQRQKIRDGTAAPIQLVSLSDLHEPLDREPEAQILRHIQSLELRGILSHFPTLTAVFLQETPQWLIGRARCRDPSRISQLCRAELLRLRGTLTRESFYL